MYCQECGTQIPDNSKFCLNCGHVVLDKKANDKASQSHESETTKTAFAQSGYSNVPIENRDRQGSKKVGLAVIVILVFVLCGILFTNHGKTDLRTWLPGQWEHEEGDLPFLMTITDDMIIIKSNTGYSFDSLFASYTYEITGANEILVRNSENDRTQKIKVKFNSSNDRLVFSPGLGANFREWNR